MSDPKWSKGPWRVVGPLGHGIFVTSEDRQIAVVYGAAVTAEGPENARLVTAAPELYDVLYKILNNQSSAIPSPLLQPDLTALAKARGEA